MLKVKLMDDNTTSRININNKGSFIKKNNIKEDIYLLNNNNDYNFKKYNKKL